MTKNEFIEWLKGYIDGLYTSDTFSNHQIKVITEKLKTVDKGNEQLLSQFIPQFNIIPNCGTRINPSFQDIKYSPATQPPIIETGVIPEITTSNAITGEKITFAMPENYLDDKINIQEITNIPQVMLSCYDGVIK